MASSSTRAESQGAQFLLMLLVVSSLIGAFMSSGRVFKTKIGVGSVIKGWDEGVQNDLRHWI